jgi:hypothetical protein
LWLQRPGTSPFVSAVPQDTYADVFGTGVNEVALEAAKRATVEKLAEKNATLHKEYEQKTALTKGDSNAVCF